MKTESSGISVGLSRCSRCPIWCADATHTQNLAKSDPATTPAPWTVQWHLKALKSARGLRRNRISPRSFPRDTCDNLRPNRPWRSPRVKNQAIELANSSHWRGRCSHVDSVEKSAYAKHLRTNKEPPLPRSDPHLCPKSPTIPMDRMGGGPRRRPSAISPRPTTMARMACRPDALRRRRSETRRRPRTTTNMVSRSGLPRSIVDLPVRMPMDVRVVE